MARLNIIICDLCKSMSKVTLPFGITLQSGKGKNKELTKAEICQKCYDSTRSRIESDFEFNNSFSSRPRTENRIASHLSNPDKIEIAAGESIVPSNVDNIAPPPQKKCLHDEKSIYDYDDVTETSYLRCKECGEEWEA